MSVGYISNLQPGKPERILYLLYHEIFNGPRRYSYALDIAEFVKQVGYFVSLREVERAGLQPAVTFDDGHLSNFEYALPVLQARNMQARFFITVGWTGKKSDYMGWSELRSVHGAGQLIGAHGWSHTLLTHCDAGGLKRELNGARAELEDKLGAAITSMSLPGGRYNRRVIAACEEAGYTEVFTSVPQAEAVPHGLLVGRLNVRGDMTLEWIARLFSQDGRLLSGLGRQYRMKSYAKAMLGDAVYEKLWAVLNRREQDGGDNGELR